MSSDDRTTVEEISYGNQLPAGFHHYRMSTPEGEYPVAVFCADEDAPATVANQLSLARAIARDTQDHGQLIVALGSAEQLRDSGAEVLTVTDFGLVDPALAPQQHCPLQPWDDTATTAWVKAEALHEPDRQAWVPYTLALPNPWVEFDRQHPDEGRLALFHPPYRGGIGAGSSLKEATTRAWNTAVAEDVLATFWATETIALTEEYLATPLTDSFTNSGGLQLRLAATESGLNEFCTLALVDHPENQLATLGAARGRGKRAQEEAIAHALIQWASCAALADEQNPLYQAESLPLPPHRRERDYLAAAAEHGYRGLVDPLANLQLCLDPSVRARIIDKWERGLDYLSAAQAASLIGASEGSWLASTPQTGALPVITDGLAEVEAWRVDLTAAGSETQVVRLLSPDTLKITVGAFPPARQWVDDVVASCDYEPASEFLPYPGL